MKKRLFCTALCMLLLLSCIGSPALAADGAEDTVEAELTGVLLSVKEQLGIDDSYTTFSSSYDDFGLMRYWYLDWLDDDGNSISVTAGDDAVIYSVYYTYADTVSTGLSSTDYAPSFPDVTSEQLQALAADFVTPLLPETMSVQFNPVSLSTSGTSSSAFLTGTLYRNGVETDLTVSVRISLLTLQVTRYYRSDWWDGYYSQEIPDPVPVVSESEAEVLLSSTWSVSLQYVDLPDGSIALCYVPESSGSWFVDAQSGELADLDAIFASLEASGLVVEEAETALAADTSTASISTGLSAVEEAAVTELAGALSAEELDTLLRQYDALGLEGMTQTGISYVSSTDGSESPLMRLTYSRVLTEDEISDDYDPEEIELLIAYDEARITKYITVDPFSGQIIRITTSDYLTEDLFDGDEAAVSADFLADVYPEEYAQTTTEDGSLYVRTVNGIPYSSNSLRATVCGLDGSIRTFSISWNEEAEFPAPDGILTQEEAAGLCEAELTTTLRYLSCPEAADTSTAEGAAYVLNMLPYTYRFILAWEQEGLSEIQGIDAFSGEILSSDTASSQAAVYTDLAGSWAREQIETLAAYGIGFGDSDTFLPAEEMTQAEMLVLLLNACGFEFDLESVLADEEEMDILYEDACTYGLVTKAERDPDRLVTRMDFIKAIISGSPYAPAAALTGIYQVSFADAGELQEEELAFAALAEGLGLVSGDENRNLNPDRVITRQEAAAILYNYMSR